MKEVIDKGTIGQRIAQLRIDKGQSQKDLADIILVQMALVNCWENNTKLPKIDEIVKLADFFDVTCDYIIRGTRPDNAKIYRKACLPENAIKILANNNVEDTDYVITTANSFLENDSTWYLFKEIALHHHYEVLKATRKKHYDDECYCESGSYNGEADICSDAFMFLNRFEYFRFHEYSLKEEFINIVKAVNGDVTEEEIELARRKQVLEYWLDIDEGSFFYEQLELSGQNLSSEDIINIFEKMFLDKQIGKFSTQNFTKEETLNVFEAYAKDIKRQCDKTN